MNKHSFLRMIMLNMLKKHNSLTGGHSPKQSEEKRKCTPTYRVESNAVHGLTNKTHEETTMNYMTEYNPGCKLERTEDMMYNNSSKFTGDMRKL